MYSHMVKSKAVPHHKYGGAGGEMIQLLLIHVLGATWRWVVSFASQLLYPRGNTPVAPDTWPVGLQRLVVVAKRKNLRCWETNHGRPTHNLATMLTELTSESLLAKLYRSRKSSVVTYHLELTKRRYAYKLEFKLIASQYLNVHR